MSTLQQNSGTRTQVTVTGLATLASATYVASAVIDNTTNKPSDLLLELNITPGTVSGNKQCKVFAIASIDNSNFQTGPTSGTTTTDEPDLTPLGTLALNSNSTAQRGFFTVAQFYGGVLPPYLKIVLLNDSGAAFTAGTLYKSEISLSSV
jgi:hypothetical protein